LQRTGIFVHDAFAVLPSPETVAYLSLALALVNDLSA
jgi:hypothetical protein